MTEDRHRTDSAVGEARASVGPGRNGPARADATANFGQSATSPERTTFAVGPLPPESQVVHEAGRIGTCHADGSGLGGDGVLGNREEDVIPVEAHRHRVGQARIVDLGGDVGEAGGEAAADRG